jgi:hypothetical protein
VSFRGTASGGNGSAGTPSEILEFRTARVWEAVDAIALVDMTADASDEVAS